MSLADELKKRDLSSVLGPRKRVAPLWQGPEDPGPQGGITFSLLSRWLVCKERFRLYAIEGLAPPGRFNHRLEYGNLWHLCEEWHARGTDRQTSWESALLAHAKKLAERYPEDQEEVDKWYNVCKLQFPIYVNYWSRHPDMLARTPLLSESIFHVPYRLPRSSRIVYLRGKWDSVDLVEQVVGHPNKKWEKVLYLQENKSKGEVNTDQMQRQLRFDLQTMLYLTALNEFIKRSVRGEEHSVFSDMATIPSIQWVRYNVVRRPLSGGKYTIKQNKGETIKEFYHRLAGLIRSDPEWFFMRWNIDIADHDLKVFRRSCLNPILEQLCSWYAAFSGKDVEIPRLDAYNLHFRTPYGVYNSLLEGRVGEYDNAIDAGTTVGLRSVNDLFPELAA